MDPLLSSSGKTQFNPFVLINCTSSHHSFSFRFLTYFERNSLLHKMVHLQGLWASESEDYFFKLDVQSIGSSSALRLHKICAQIPQSVNVTQYLDVLTRDVRITSVTICMELFLVILIGILLRFGWSLVNLTS